MKASCARVAITSAIFLVLLGQIFAAPTPPPDSSTLGVNLNDSFTYVVTKIINSIDPTLYVGPGKYSGIEFTLQKGDTFAITITNTTIGSIAGKDHFLELTLNNGTHSIISDNLLAPGLGFVSFTNWSSWEPLINSDPVAYFNDADYLNHTLTRDYAEYKIEYWLSRYYNATDSFLMQIVVIYDVTTGVYLNQRFKAYNFKLSSNPEFEISRQGYIKPPPPSSTTSNATNSVITTSNSTITTTSSSSTRDQAIFTPSLDRNTTDESSEISGLPREEDENESSSPTAILPVPGFGVIISFTALITIFTLLKFRKY